MAAAADNSTNAASPGSVVEKAAETTEKDTQGVAKGADTASAAKKKAKNAAKARITAEWPNGPRTSIEHYEEVEIAGGRLDPLMEVFWRGRYQFSNKKPSN
tara:strand:- start:509 stop:811 length:303 start_codon:yes stop_codon:yes gene_type:complete